MFKKQMEELQKESIANMWCVLYAKDENERQTEEFITKLLPESICIRCFHITRHKLMKREGQWKEEAEKLLPGYVFIETDQPELVYRKLKKASKHLLFSDDDFVSVLSENDLEFLAQITDKYGRIRLSTVRIKKAGSKREIEYLSGPLAKVSDKVGWIDLHRRFAKVDAGFLKDGKGLSLSFYFEGEEVSRAMEGNDEFCGM